jgi:hypothetical protein
MINAGAKKSKRVEKDMAAAVAFNRTGSKVRRATWLFSFLE